MNTMNPRDEKDEIELFEETWEASEKKYNRVRQKFADDNRFSHGDSDNLWQWPDGVRQQREEPENERPMITVNRVDPLVRRVVNEAKQQKIGAIVKPKGDGASANTADFLADWVRANELRGLGARHAIMWAYECAVRGGHGFFRINRDWADPSGTVEDMSAFRQVLSFGRIRDPLSVHWDPYSQEVDGSDAKIAIVEELISPAAAKKLQVDPAESLSIQPNPSVWRSGEDVRLGEMFWWEENPDTLLMLAGPQGAFVRLQSKLEAEIGKDGVKRLLGTPGAVLATRKVDRREIKWAKFCDGRRIGKTEWSGRYIPIVPIFGRESFADDQIDWRGITRNSKDANRRYNYMASLEVERIALAPRAPWVAANEQLEGFEDDWRESNVKNLAVLTYNPTVLGGLLVPPPQRNDAVSGDPYISQAMMSAADDVKVTSNLFDPSMGRPSEGAKSGRAILAENMQGSMATFDFLENLSASWRHATCIQLDLAKDILRGEQQVDARGDDGQSRSVWVNRSMPAEGSQDAYHYEIGKGEYEVEIDIGPADQTRREQLVESLSKFLGYDKEMARVTMDIIFENMDIKGRDRLVRRLRHLVPPDVLAAEKGDDEQKPNPELEALQQHAEQIIGELKTQVQEFQAKIAELQEKADSKAGELNLKQGELDLKRDEFNFKRETELRKAESDPQALSNVLAGMAEQQDTLAEGLRQTQEGVTILAERLGQVAEAIAAMQQQEQQEPHAQPASTPPGSEFEGAPTAGYSAGQPEGMPPADAPGLVGDASNA